MEEPENESPQPAPIDLKPFVIALAVARKQVADATVERSRAADVLKARPEHERWTAAVEKVARLQNAESDAYDRLVTAAKIVYSQTKNKDVTDGVKIRVMRRCTYDPGKVLAWAQEHANYLVKTVLDTARFEKGALAGALEGVPTMDILEVPSVAADSDLTRFLPEETYE